MKESPNQYTSWKWLACAAVIWTPCVLVAHPGNGASHSFASGFTHFFTGWDHLVIASLAGLLLASCKQRTYIANIAVGILVPGIMTGLHAWASGEPLLAGAAGLMMASMGTLWLSSIQLKGSWNQAFNNTYLQRSSIGFALLAMLLMHY
ncbi:HupE/UreJ family protein [Verrucomicrobia bacterium]|jgi:hydrogenase/urease accessory protein HupE|nr:HupE/UreJ family protein [Verrucomicrobiota bacterium]MDB4664948.1 HupE/UreJ family protein [Verrucomicrobiota bacterium]MDG1890933.1 HupE/UreJ family protein [Verrucomicrobiota bacterium]